MQNKGNMRCRNNFFCVRNQLVHCKPFKIFKVTFKKNVFFLRKKWRSRAIE